MTLGSVLYPLFFTSTYLENDSLSHLLVNMKLDPEDQLFHFTVEIMKAQRSGDFRIMLFQLFCS